MPSRSELRQYYEIGAQLAPAIHQHQDWPYEVPHPQYVAYMAPPHDVGGEADAPVRYEEKEEELWELNTYVTCEVLGWRGAWNAEEKAPPWQQRSRSVALLRLPLLRTLDLGGSTNACRQEPRFADRTA